MRYISNAAAELLAGAAEPEVAEGDYRKLAAFRAALRKFLRKSEDIVHAAGFTPQQHQTLLAIKGFPGPGKPTVKDLAARLQIRHNSAVGLVNRLEGGGYLRRAASAMDRRCVCLELTRKGEAMLHRLTHAHRVELHLIGPEIKRLLTELTG
jgi:DNA-binding MarR family transcriptional regulator